METVVLINFLHYVNYNNLTLSNTSGIRFSHSCLPFPFDSANSNNMMLACLESYILTGKTAQLHRKTCFFSKVRREAGGLGSRQGPAWGTGRVCT
jgi:hypothetical protein